MTTQELNAVRDELILDKKRHELALAKIKNNVRGRGLLRPEKYAQCVAAQNRHATVILKIEERLVSVKSELRLVFSNQQTNRKETQHDHIKKSVPLL